MTAGKNDYAPGTTAGNFIIRDDGQLISGGEITLNGRNGDIEITDDIKATKGLTVNIAKQGNVDFGTDVDVKNNVDISTDKGNITVGHAVESKDGSVSMKSGDGDITVGEDITAGKKVELTTKAGDITVGNDTTGKGKVEAAGDVTVETGAGDVKIVKSVTSTGESVTVKSGSGNIHIGNNGPDVDTVTANKNVTLETVDGTITVDA